MYEKKKTNIEKETVQNFKKKEFSYFFYTLFIICWFLLISGDDLKKFFFDLPNSSISLLFCLN